MFARGDVQKNKASKKKKIFFLSRKKETEEGRINPKQENKK